MAQVRAQHCEGCADDNLVTGILPAARENTESLSAEEPTPYRELTPPTVFQAPRVQQG